MQHRDFRRKRNGAPETLRGLRIASHPDVLAAEIVQSLKELGIGFYGTLE